MSAVFVHPSSFVDEPCTIGAGTRIWHFCHVMPHATIGRDCVLGQNVLVSSHVVLGDNCKIQNNVSLYTGVVLEDHVFCGPSMVFTNVINPRSEVVRKEEYRRTLVRRGASIGANATIVCGVTIGPYSMVAAGSTVTNDVPPHSLVIGSPARVVAYICRNGHRMRPLAALDYLGSYRCDKCDEELRVSYEVVDNPPASGRPKRRREDRA